MAVTKIHTADFEAEVINAKGRVLLDFYADWCGPCKMLAPVLDELSEKEPEIKILKINVDTDRELATKFEIRSIPTLIVMEGGEEKFRSLGYKTLEELITML